MASKLNRSQRQMIQRLLNISVALLEMARGISTHRDHIQNLWIESRRHDAKDDPQRAIEREQDLKNNLDLLDVKLEEISRLSGPADRLARKVIAATGEAFEELPGTAFAISSKSRMS